MSLTPEQVTKIARLSRLRLQESEKTKAQQELNKIFDWIAQLQAVNTDGMEPLASVIAMGEPLRKDEVTDGNKQQDILHNSPVAPRYGHFVVPKVVE